MFQSVAEVQAYIKKNGIRFVDFKMIDLHGRWRHLCIPAGRFDESLMKNGIGFVVMKDGEIVSGASSYSAYVGGIEIEVDTAVSERRKNLASAVCARLICECLDLGLYPSWDAQNKVSLRLAEKLGYEFSHEYTSYEIKH